ncbi:unnamed protein product [Effrenium voratum]|uniref:Uncharacterized protein n=1 Tax=Effrenium voratum TaxID=2562239 RepID=A0AA36N2I2_9DINO|nr:unnamed protein product [Effrenium voratum]
MLPLTCLKTSGQCCLTRAQPTWRWPLTPRRRAYGFALLAATRLHCRAPSRFQRRQKRATADALPEPRPRCPPLTPPAAADYPADLHRKAESVQQLLSERLRRDGTGDLQVVPSPELLHYRHRVRFEIRHTENETVRFAVFDPEVSGWLFVDHYPIASLRINQLMADLRAALEDDQKLRWKAFQVELLSNTQGQGLALIMYHRRLDAEDQLLAARLGQRLEAAVVLRAKRQRLPKTGGFLLQENEVAGKLYTQQLLESSFFQANLRLNQLMQTWVVQQTVTQQATDLLEMYCGNGNFTLPAAANFRRVLATEIDTKSLAGAEACATQAGVANIFFKKCKAEEMQLQLPDYDFSTLLVDPPRAGLSERAREMAENFPQLIYISCNPRTLARDLALMDNFRIEAACLFDQFPWTDHAEVALRLVNKNATLATLHFQAAGKRIWFALIVVSWTQLLRALPGHREGCGEKSRAGHFLSGKWAAANFRRRPFPRDLTQDAIRPAARLDVADLLTQALGVGMPRRSDFMAGGSSASRSYLLLVHRAAKQVLEECEPYVALKHWLQRAEVPLPARDMPMPSAERAIQAAQRAVQEADAAGSAWLTERGEVWCQGWVAGGGGVHMRNAQLSAQNSLPDASQPDLAGWMSQMGRGKAIARGGPAPEEDSGGAAKNPLVRALLHVQWASLLQKAGKHDRAEEHFRSSLELVPSARAHFGRGTCLAALRRRAEAAEELEAAVRLCPKMVGALINLAGVYLGLGDFQKAEKLCRDALALEPGSREAVMNLANALRNLGRREEAVQLVCQQIQQHEAEVKETQDIRTPPINCAQWRPSPCESQLVIACLKWGQRYNADYVNRLCAACRRSLSQPAQFVCFTEDPTGLAEDIEVKTLPNNLPLWWGKAFLFSEEAGLDGKRVLFLDLDQVIVGDLGPLAAYEGPFAILATDGIACELAAGGYNSSVISFQGSPFWRPLFQQLTPSVLRFVHRFDHWLEMMVDGADLWQKLLPGKVVDYTAAFRGGVCIGGDDDGAFAPGLEDGASKVSASEPPAGCAIVTFPRSPKPHEVVELHGWVQRHWSCAEPP